MYKITGIRSENTSVVFELGIKHNSKPNKNTNKGYIEKGFYFKNHLENRSDNNRNSNNKSSKSHGFAIFRSISFADPKAIIPMNA